MFKVGDIVDWLGLRGRVTSLNGLDNYPVICHFDGQEECNTYFNQDGVFMKGQTPSLKLIERPKKKVKKTIERWVNVYPYGILLVGFLSEEEARKEALGDCITQVKLTGEYEIEE
jgi:hypothetical protein